MKEISKLFITKKFVQTKHLSSTLFDHRVSDSLFPSNFPLQGLSNTAQKTF